MRRKELGKVSPVPLSVKSITTEYHVEAQIIKQGDEEILELDMYEKSKELLCRHFVSKKSGWDTVFEKDGKFEYRGTFQKGEWRTLRYCTILNQGDHYNYYYTKRTASYSDKALDIIKNYVTASNWCSSDIAYQIDEIESRVARKKESTAYERKCVRIQNEMDKVVPLDDDFETWMKNSVFKNRYIFAETRSLKRGYRCRCATCGKTFLNIEKPKHNSTMACKKCGTEAIIKTRVSNVQEKKNILVVQKYDDNSYVLRHFRTEMYSAHFMNETSMKLHVYEKVRMILEPDKRTKIYYGTEVKADEFEQDWWTSKGFNVIDKSFRMYPGRISETNMKKSLKNTVMEAANAGKEMDFNNMIRCMEYHPYMEYLVKSRFYRLANEILRIYGYWSRPDELFDLFADNPADLLQLDRQRMYRLRDIDGGIHALELLQIEVRDGMKVSQENLIFVNDNSIDTDKLERHRTGLPINKALNFFRRQMERNKMSFQTIRQYYTDYLNMAVARNMDLSDDIVRLNTKMVEFHNQYVEEDARKANEKRFKEVNKKFKNIETNYKLNCEKMAWENEEYIMMVPKNASEIVLEGRLQHHCVGSSDTYMERMNKGEGYILFLRRKDNPDKPYYTLEIKGNKIVQRYAAYNRQPEIGKINGVLSQWQNEVARREKEKVKQKTSIRPQVVMLQVAAG